MRGLGGLILGQLFIHASMAGLRMALPLQLLRAGGTKLEVGMLVAVFSLAQVLLALPAGRLTDRRGYHLPLRLAAACTMAGASLAVASSLLPGTAHRAARPGRVAGGRGRQPRVDRDPTHGRSAGPEQHRAQAHLQLARHGSLAQQRGRSRGRRLAHRRRRVSRLLCLPRALAARQSGRHPLRVAGARRAAQLVAKTKRPAWDLLRGSQMQRLLLVNWFTSTSWDLHSFLVPVLGVERGFSASAVGSILSTFAFAVTADSLCHPRVRGRLKESTVLRAALVTIAVMFAVYPWVSSAWGMALCALVLGVALGSSQPMILTSLHHITPNDRQGEALALRSMTINAASTVTPLLFGALGTAVGPDLLFWTMSGLVGAGSFVTRSITGTSGEAAESG